MGLDADNLKRWSELVAAAPLDYRARVEAALDHRPAVRRWVEQRVRGFRISVQGVALYYAGIILFAWQQEAGVIPHLGGKHLAAALEATAAPTRGVTMEQLPGALFGERPHDSARREVVAALLERETPPGFLPLRGVEPAGLAVLLCALLSALEEAA